MPPTFHLNNNDFLRTLPTTLIGLTPDGHAAAIATPGAGTLAAYGHLMPSLMPGATFEFTGGSMEPYATAGSTLASTMPFLSGRVVHARNPQQMTARAVDPASEDGPALQWRGEPLSAEDVKASITKVQERLAAMPFKTSKDKDGNPRLSKSAFSETFDVRGRNLCSPLLPCPALWGWP